MKERRPEDQEMMKLFGCRWSFWNFAMGLAAVTEHEFPVALVYRSMTNSVPPQSLMLQRLVVCRSLVPRALYQDLSGFPGRLNMPCSSDPLLL
ncbi:hypothetical protein KQX54_014171 [Cotesia glomerata]|uniref:Uncharacterized protein n=1 Tax=Cotesia glomerata TaxID=32391 RepID=A0AAV7IUQ2_COTGL|nr:hypothetical protein KQX54_014171 [Cotesia glomerata]